MSAWPTLAQQDKMRRDWLKDDKEEGVCMHCGAETGDESYICEKCYSKYTPGMLADLED